MVVDSLIWWSKNQQKISIQANCVKDSSLTINKSPLLPQSINILFKFSLYVQIDSRKKTKRALQDCELLLHFQTFETTAVCIQIVFGCRAEVRRSFVTTTVRKESQVTPQGRHR